jgi:hypothetical protein
MRFLTISIKKARLRLTATPGNRPHPSQHSRYPLRHLLPHRGRYGADPSHPARHAGFTEHHAGGIRGITSLEVFARGSASSTMLAGVMVSHAEHDDVHEGDRYCPPLPTFAPQHIENMEISKDLQFSPSPPRYNECGDVARLGFRSFQAATPQRARPSR